MTLWEGVQPVKTFINFAFHFGDYEKPCVGQEMKLHVIELYNNNNNGFMM